MTDRLLSILRRRPLIRKIARSRAGRALRARLSALDHLRIRLKPVNRAHDRRQTALLAGFDAGTRR